MSTPSIRRPSSLSERLQADQEQTQRQLADQTQKLLEQHAAGLKKLFFDALRSTRSASERHRAEVETLHQTTLTRMHWLLLWPIAATVLLSLLMLVAVATWTTYQLDRVEQAQAALDQESVSLAAQQQATQPVLGPLPRKRR